MQKNKQSRSKGYVGKQMREAKPPQFKSEIVLQRRMRFKASAAVDQVSLQYRDLASSVVGIVALTTTTSGVLARAIRVKSIEMWFTAATAGTPVEGVIDWNSEPGTAYIAGPGSSVSATSTSVGEYTHLKSRPLPTSGQNFWHTGNDTASACTVTVPAGGILDITCEFVYNDSANALSGASITGATIGTWYHKQPDVNLVVMGNLNSIA